MIYLFYLKFHPICNQVCCREFDKSSITCFFKMMKFMRIIQRYTKIFSFLNFDNSLFNLLISYLFSIWDGL